MGVKVLHRAFGSALRGYRLRAGLSQEQLAERAEIDRTFVSLLERGLRQPSLETIFQIAAALGRSPANLVSKTADLAARVEVPKPR